jgi:hypothetical protein
VHSVSCFIKEGFLKSDFLADSGQNYGNSQDNDEGGSGGMNFGAGKRHLQRVFTFNLVVVKSNFCKVETNAALSAKSRAPNLFPLLIEIS